MNRRSFIVALISGLVIAVLSRLPWTRERYGAVFQFVFDAPEMKMGRDIAVPARAYVYNARRCCKNCTLIFAASTPGGDVHNGPCFVPLELRPMNVAARRLAAEIAREGHDSSTAYALVS